MKIRFLGDIVNRSLNHISIDSDLVSHFNNADTLNIGNLEAPIVRYSHQQIKSGPNISNKENILDFLDALNIKQVCLANNHMADYGHDGLKETIGFLNASNINYTGIRSKEGDICTELSDEVCLYNLCENEWVELDGNDFSINSLSLIHVSNEIRKLSDLYKHVIIIFHGGVEKYFYPTPLQKELFRSFIDSGASVVVGHHSHCLGGYEEYKDGLIFYSLGNFYFPSSDNSFDWNIGMILELSILSGKISYSIDFVQNRNNKLKLVKRNDVIYDNLFSSLEGINSIIQDDVKLEREYINLIKNDDGFLITFLLYGRNYIARLMRKIGLLDKIIPQYRILYNLNFIRSEFHREKVIASFKKKINENRNSPKEK